MNNIFSPKRFWNYFLFELRNAKNNFGLSLLITALLPVFMFVMVELVNLIVNRSFTGYSTPYQVCALVVAAIVLVTNGPVKIYGNLTDKRSGSDYLMIPASTAEKFVSLLLVTCVVMPLVSFVLFFGSDLLLSLIPGYGTALINGDTPDFITSVVSSAGLISPSMLVFATYLSWCENVLAFTLGSMIFKKAKVGKTILCYFALMMVLTTFLGFFIPHIDGSMLERIFEDITEDKAQFWFNVLINTFYLIFFAAIDVAIYLRLRTMKH